MRRWRPDPEVSSSRSADEPESPFARSTILPPAPSLTTPPSVEPIPATVSVPTEPPVPADLDIIAAVTAVLAEQLAREAPDANPLGWGAGAEGEEDEDDDDDRPTLKRSEVVRAVAPEENVILRALAKGITTPAGAAEDVEEERAADGSSTGRSSIATLPSRVA